MAARKVKLIYGKEDVEFNVDDGFLAGPVLDTRKPQSEPVQAEAAIKAALAAPAGRPPLRQMAKGKVTGIIISDEFRAGLQNEIASALIKEAAAGAPREIRVFVATGSHEPAIYAKNLKPFLEAELEKSGVPSSLVLNDCDKSDFVDLGRTPRGSVVGINRALMECDLRVYGHESKHHYMCGYSNIDKQVVPGVASRRSIEMSHKNSLDHENAIAGRSPWHRIAGRRFNPFAEDLRDGRALSERFRVAAGGALVEGGVETFGLDMVSEKDKVYWIKAGDPGIVSREMTGAVDSLAEYAVGKVKYVAISPGGPPACQALYGVQNCFDMALKGAISNGGEALVVAPCNGRPDLPPDVKGLAPDGKSKALFWDNLVRLRDKPLAECVEFLDRNFELYMWKTDRVVKLFKANGVRIWLYCDLPEDLVKAGGFRKCTDVQAWIDERAARGDGKIRIINNGNKMLVSPE
jgi:nickel-dependent lactate racemase